MSGNHSPPRARRFHADGPPPARRVLERDAVHRRGASSTKAAPSIARSPVRGRLGVLRLPGSPRPLPVARLNLRHHLRAASDDSPRGAQPSLAHGALSRDGPSPGLRIVALGVHDELQHGHDAPGGYRGSAAAAATGVLVGPGPLAPCDPSAGREPGPPPPPPYPSRRRCPPRRARSRSSPCPPAHITEHELRQFLLFSMPQCRSNAVVVRTTPSPRRPTWRRSSPDPVRTCTGTWRASPVHVVDPAAHGGHGMCWLTSAAGGGSRGSPSVLPPGSCSSSSSSVILRGVPADGPAGPRVSRLPPSSSGERRCALVFTSPPLRPSFALAIPGGGAAGLPPPRPLCAFPRLLRRCRCFPAGIPVDPARLARPLFPFCSAIHATRSASVAHSHGRRMETRPSSAGTFARSGTPTDFGPMAAATRRGTLCHFPHPAASQRTTTRDKPGRWRLPLGLDPARRPLSRFGALGSFLGGGRSESAGDRGDAPPAAPPPASLSPRYCPSSLLRLPAAPRHAVTEAAAAFTARSRRRRALRLRTNRAERRASGGSTTLCSWRRRHSGPSPLRRISPTRPSSDAANRPSMDAPMAADRPHARPPPRRYGRQSAGSTAAGGGEVAERERAAPTGASSCADANDDAPPVVPAERVAGRDPPVVLVRRPSRRRAARVDVARGGAGLMSTRRPATRARAPRDGRREHLRGALRRRPWPRTGYRGRR